MGCEFCFSEWRQAKRQLPILKVKHVLDCLKENGLKAINLTGGEVLLREDIIQICKYAKEIGLITIISTNGIELMNKKEVLNYIDAINLPLDSHDPKIHNQMRPSKTKNHYQLVLELIDYININHPNVKIKINTLVSKFNLTKVSSIGRLISGKVFRWKLGRFFSSGFGKQYESKYAISATAFNAIVQEVEQKYPNSGFFGEDFILSNDDDMFIDNQGQVVLITKNGLINIGGVEKLKELNNVENGEEYFNRIYKMKGDSHES